MTRTPQEVFEHHGQVFGVEDIDGILADFADDAGVITPAGKKYGKDGIRQAYKQLFTELPHAAWDIRKQVFVDDVLFIEWAADTASARADGVDTFVFRDGKIHAQTIHYNLQHKN